MNISFIYSFEQSLWKSCQTITSNLLDVYRISMKDANLRDHNYNSKMNDYEIFNMAKEVFEFKPTKVIVIDHKPHIAKFIKILNDFYTKKSSAIRPEIIIHVFGDFTLFGKEWMASEAVLKKFSVKFVCASDKQQDLVSKFLKEKSDGPLKCPFPVDSKQFYFSESIRASQRKLLNIPENQIVFLYTGRMSLQKKVIDLVIDFSYFLNFTNHDIVLYLAGEFDDLGNPFTGFFYKDGEFCQRYMRVIEQMDEKQKSRIKYIGNLDQKELLNYYNLADVYISMSTHNDEDYGMSPAEALCTGLPAILTDWAGYSSFKLGNENATSLIPTVMDEETSRINYNKSNLMKTFMMFCAAIATHRDKRASYAKINNEVFSINAAIPVLKNIFKQKAKPFRGFTGYMEELAAAFAKKEAPFVDVKRVTTYNKFYKKMYESYVSKEL